ncbi:MAG: hypothetical protein ABUJ92_00180 [Desulfobacterales bacterium]
MKMTDFEYIKKTLAEKSGVPGYRQKIASAAKVSKSLLDKIAIGHENVIHTNITAIAKAMRAYKPTM